MSDKIIIAGQLSGFTPRKDHTLSLRFSTQEYDRSQISLDDLKEKFLDQYGILYFRTGEQPIQADLMNELDAVDIDVQGKTVSRSKGLYNRIWRLWNSTKKDQMEFKEFYNLQIDKFDKYITDQIID